MRTRRRSARGDGGDLGHTLFGGTGWLFADLMLALAAIFLVANTVGFLTPSKSHHAGQEPTPTPHPTKSPRPKPVGLNPDYLSLAVPVTPASVRSAGQPAITRLIKDVNKQLTARDLSNRRVGFVIVLAYGADDPADQDQAVATARTVVHALHREDHPIFASATGIGYWGGSAVDGFTLKIFFLY